MKKSKRAIGVTVKISGNCSLVGEVTLLMEEWCKVLHKSRAVSHVDDDGCHIFIDLSEVKK